MKFSYTLLKQLAPKISSKEALIEKLNFHAFEAVAVAEDTIEISITPNRYSDAASHWGIAKIAAALFGGKATDFAKEKSPKAEKKGIPPVIKISVKKACARYIGRFLEVSSLGQSPDWLKNILTACGMRPINAVVDVMNYVMLEVGQPLHAFDADLVEGFLEVRYAQQGEEIKTIDGQNFNLTANDLVIVDAKGPLAIAGIKGGKRAEITPKTRRIIIESANFDSVSIYKTTRQLNLVTDASSRFSHGLSPWLAEVAIKRAAVLLKDVAKANLGETGEVSFYRPGKRVLKFDIKRFNRLTGLNFEEKEALAYLKKLDFKVSGKIVEIPVLRSDVSIFEDLVEEIVNLHGYEKLPATAPHVPIRPAGKEDAVLLKDKARAILSGLGLSEVYNYTFVSRQDLSKYSDLKSWDAPSLLNPVSADFQYLRPTLAIGLLKNVESNFRFYDSERIFEIGRTFVEDGGNIKESLKIGIALGSKAANPILELKGLADQALKGMGLVDVFFRELDQDLRYLEPEKSLRVESDHQVIGYIGIPKGEPRAAVLEIDFDKLVKMVAAEKEYEPLPKFPTVMRDVSVLVGKEIRVDQLMAAMENAAPKYLDDVDLVDYYDPEDESNTRAKGKSFTFRLVFSAEDKTLTDEEVNVELKAITDVLVEKFGAEIR